MQEWEWGILGAPGLPGALLWAGLLLLLSHSTDRRDRAEAGGPDLSASQPSGRLQCESSDSLKEGPMELPGAKGQRAPYVYSDFDGCYVT